MTLVASSQARVYIVLQEDSKVDCKHSMSVGSPMWKHLPEHQLHYIDP